MNKVKKKVVLVNRAVYLPGEGGYKRTLYLFDMMRRKGYDPILLTSDFNHYKKKARDLEKFKKEYPEYAKSIQFVHIPKYAKNISLKRYFAERVWTLAVKKWFSENIDKINSVMLSMPDMNTILAIEGICKQHNIEMVIDVRDLRPEAFRVLIKNDFIYNILFYTMMKKADKAYACADKLFAVSHEYLQRALQSNTKAKLKEVVYIGAVLDKFDQGVKKYSNEVEKNDNDIWLTYVGTLGESYDLYTLVDAGKKLLDLGYHHIKIMILGQGPDEEALKKYAEKIGAFNVKFLGFLDYEKMAAYLKKSDMTVNAIKKRGSQSIINKVADYLAAGVPMLNGCVSKEQQEMVDKYEIGLNYEPENVDSLVNAIIKLVQCESMCKKYGENARKLAEKKFDREYSYLRIIEGIYEK